MSPRPPVFLAASILILSVASALQAYEGGVSGRAQSSTGCSCHGSTPNLNGAVVVSISGPQVVMPGTTHTYTLAVTGDPAGTTGGFDLKSTGGTWTAGTASKVLNGELVSSTKNARSWTFNWTAPAADGVYSWYAVGMASNASGSGGDSWNWFGGAVNTPFPITVSSLLGVDGAAAPSLSLAVPSPTPFVTATRVTFVLPRAGRARIGVFDLAGRRVAVLLDDDLPGGGHAVTWNGRDLRGARVPGGVYAVRLETADGVRVRRAVLSP